MRDDLVARLRRTMRGEALAENGVAGVAGVAGVTNNVSKLLELRQQRPLRHGSSGAGEGVFRGVVEGVADSPELDAAENEERAGLADGGVPSCYLEAWARLQLQQPHGVTEARWRQAVNAAGLFLDRWGARASELRWAPSDLFDVPGGLAWRLEGCRVIYLVDEIAVMNDYRAFDRTTGSVV